MNELKNALEQRARELNLNVDIIEDLVETLENNFDIKTIKEMNKISEYGNLLSFVLGETTIDWIDAIQKLDKDEYLTLYEDENTLYEQEFNRPSEMLDCYRNSDYCEYDSYLYYDREMDKIYSYDTIEDFVENVVEECDVYDMVFDVGDTISVVELLANIMDNPLKEETLEELISNDNTNIYAREMILSCISKYDIDNKYINVGIMKQALYDNKETKWFFFNENLNQFLTIIKPINTIEDYKAIKE